MSLPNRCFPALGYDASAKETFLGCIAYNTLCLRKTDREFEALPNRQGAFSTIPNVSATETACLFSNKSCNAVKGAATFKTCLCTLSNSLSRISTDFFKKTFQRVRSHPTRVLVNGVK